METLKEKIVSYITKHNVSRSGDIATACASKSVNGRRMVSKTLCELVRLGIISRVTPAIGRGYLFDIVAKNENVPKKKKEVVYQAPPASQVFDIKVSTESTIGKAWSEQAKDLKTAYAALVPSAFDKWWNDGGFVEAAAFALDYLGRERGMAAAKDFAVQQKEWLRSAFEAGVASIKEKVDVK